MSQARVEPANHTEPDSPPQQEPTHDVPVYPERDPPPDRELDVGAVRSETDHPAQGEEPRRGREDVDEDDLDPRVPHSPPDGGQGSKDRVLFDENEVAG